MKVLLNSKSKLTLMMRNYRRNSFKGQSASTPHVQLAIEDSYKRLLNPRLHEALQEASEG
jgi:hypothetical protein